MQTDKELFNQIKETYSMNPSPEFVSNTETYLRKVARRSNRKKSVKFMSFTASGFVFSIIAVLWIFSFGGKEVIDNAITTLEKHNSSSIVNKQEPLIYIYHSHNHESFNFDPKVRDSHDATHQSKNITLVGERLSEALNQKNIATIHENRDTMGTIKERGLTFSQSYSVSREFLEENLEKRPSIKMVFDVHRDSLQGNITTINIDGKNYAKISFIISEFHSRYKENLKFAQKLHEKLEEKYPGLSSGIFSKDFSETNNTYNQDVFNESVLMNIGGVDNTFEEVNRTVDVFAEVIEEIIKTEK